MSSIVVGRALGRAVALKERASGGRRLFARPQKLPVRSFTASTRVWEKKYTEDHEWVELAPDGKTGTVGVSEYAAKALGDVVFVELPTTDLTVSMGDSIGAVESVKSASDIMTPVSGRVIEVNNVLEDQPGMINKSPEADGWLAKIECSDPTELKSLMDADSYKAFAEEAE